VIHDVYEAQPKLVIVYTLVYIVYMYYTHSESRDKFTSLKCLKSDFKILNFLHQQLIAQP
jgi:hypothetical protein